jgi:predicted ArsR family transcriptional regulator
VFKSDEAARKQLAELTQKGVRSARIGTHGTGPSKLVFQLRGLDAAAQASLQKIKQAFPRQEWRDCP